MNKSRKTSYEEAQELPTNCGVDFDGECQTWDGLFPEDPEEEFLGECEEDDEECFQRLLDEEEQYDTTSTNMAVRGSQSTKKNSLRSTQKSFDRNGSLPGAGQDPEDVYKNRMFPEMENEPFEGLPENYYKKKYRPDYPTDLRMKPVCAAKPARRRTVGTTKTQIHAYFTPSDSSFLKPEQDDRSAAGTAKKRGTGGASSLRTSMTKGDTVGISNLPFDETSPLEQNRMPPPIVSSSDEVIVDW
ncbi:hypothetical protein Ocin01_12147 [Orchesella cincta]|uniref:Uncharacterized protein n=1 Tax=Orchesella cincta TaxID=48709 RepID=A0A1D2MNU6_ORCCI|nr:hypothetical protein Ocin01_12147 [Orchesella cincta]